MNKNKKIAVPALDKGMKIFEILSHNQSPMNMSQIAKALSYKVSEIQRMVEYLNQSGYIHKNDQKGFYISSKFFSLSSRIDLHHILINRASPHMNNYALETEESIQLSILSDRELRLLVHTEGTRHLQLTIKPGMYKPVDTVSGRLLIAYLSEIERKKFKLKNQDISIIEQMKKDNEEHGYWTGESLCLQGIYKMSALISIPGLSDTAALTSTFILPKTEQLEEYTNKLLKKFLKTRKLIEQSL